MAYALLQACIPDFSSCRGPNHKPMMVDHLGKAMVFDAELPGSGLEVRYRCCIQGWEAKHVGRCLTHTDGSKKIL